MAVKIKPINEISILFPGEDETSVNSRLISYKWLKVSEIVKQISYMVTAVIAGLEILAKIFLM